MTWIDVAFLLIWVAFLGAGARYGGLWSAACVIAGFTGAFLVDTYALPLSEWIGGFPGSGVVAGVLLFVIGAAAAMVPGYILKKLTAAFFLGIVDSIFGLAAGALVGIVALALLVLLIGPYFSGVEKTRAWRESVIVKNFDHAIESFFFRPRFRTDRLRGRLREEAEKRLEPLADRAADRVMDAAEEAVNDLRGK